MIPLQPDDFQLAAPVLMTLIVLGAILQDDVTCTMVGLFASHEMIVPAWAACLAGTLLGDMIWFLLAHWLGEPMLRRRPLNRLISTESLERARAFVHRYGSWSIFLSRFLPGLRTGIHIIIGTLYQDTWRATSIFAAAAAVYTLVLVGFCRALRNSIEPLRWFQTYKVPTLVTFALVLLAALWLLRRILTPPTDSEST